MNVKHRNEKNKCYVASLGLEKYFQNEYINLYLIFKINLLHRYLFDFVTLCESLISLISRKVRNMKETTLLRVWLCMAISSTSLLSMVFIIVAGVSINTNNYTFTFDQMKFGIIVTSMMLTITLCQGSILIYLSCKKDKNAPPISSSQLPQLDIETDNNDLF